MSGNRSPDFAATTICSRTLMVAWKGGVLGSVVRTSANVTGVGSAISPSSILWRLNLWLGKKLMEQENRPQRSCRLSSYGYVGDASFWFARHQNGSFTPFIFRLQLDVSRVAPRWQPVGDWLWNPYLDLACQSNLWVVSAGWWSRCATIS